MKAYLLIIALLSVSGLHAQEIVKKNLIGSPTDSEMSVNIVADDANNSYVAGQMNNKGLIVKQNPLHQTVWSKTITFPPAANNYVSIGFLDIVADTVFGCGLIRQLPNALTGTFYFKMNAQTGAFYWCKYEMASNGYVSSMRYANGKFFLVGGTEGSNISIMTKAKAFAVSSQTGSLIWETPLLSYTVPGGGSPNTRFTASTEMYNGKMFITGISGSSAPAANIEENEPLLVGISESGNIFMRKRILLSFLTNTALYSGTRIEYDMDHNILLTCSNPVLLTVFPNDPDLVLIKLDTLGNIIFSKEYEIDGHGSPNGPGPVGYGLNETADSYVLSGPINTNFVGLFVLKVDKHGELQQCIGLQKPNIFYAAAFSLSYGGSNSYGNSAFKNGLHYFAATETPVSLNDNNINQVIFDEDLNLIVDCSELTELPVVIPPLSIQLEQMQETTTANAFVYQDGIIAEDLDLYVSCANISLDLAYTPGCQTLVTANVEGFESPVFHWSDGTNSTSNTLSTNQDTVIVFVQDVRCCQLTDTIVLVPASTMAMSLPADTTLCLPQGNTLTLTPQVTNPGSPVSYSWSDNSTASTLSVTNSGVYWVDVSDSCFTIRDSILVTVLELPEITGLSDTAVCEGNFPVLLTPAVSGTASLLWSNGATTNSTTVGSEGQITLQATNICGTVSATAIVTQVDLPEISLIASIDTCLQDGGPIVLVPVLDDVSITTWSDGTTGTSLTVSETGVYTVYGSNACGTDSASCTITIRELPEITGLSDTSVCEGNFPVSFVPTVSGAATVLWSNGATTNSTTVGSAGQITLQATNVCGTVSATAMVTQIDLPEISLIASIDTCLHDGTSIVLAPVLDDVTVTSWSDGTAGSSLTVSATGVYTVYGSNVCGTDSAACTVVIREFPDLYLPATLDTCFEIGTGFSYTAQGSPGAYQWNSGSQTATEWITQEGLYICTLTNQCGSTVDSMRVKRLAALDLFIPKDSLHMCEQQITVNLLQIETNYDYELFAPWTGLQVESDISESGWYRIRVFNACGELWDSIYVDLQNEQTLYMPNTFTPNGDGINDQLELTGTNINVTNFWIFNRWGEEIYTQEMPVNAWDGSYKGQPCPDGLYVVKVRYENCFGIPTEFEGHVNLLR